MWQCLRPQSVSVFDICASVVISAATPATVSMFAATPATVPMSVVISSSNVCYVCATRNCMISAMLVAVVFMLPMFACDKLLLITDMVLPSRCRGQYNNILVWLAQ